MRTLIAASRPSILSQDHGDGAIATAVRLAAMILVLAVTAAACANNRAAAPTGWVDHNNDGYEDGGM